MSVRRLADPEFQPEGFTFNRANGAWAKRTIKKYPKGREQSAVIPLLMRAQEQEGWVTRASIEAIADMLDMPYIRALEVATFYTQFQLKPVGTRAHVQVCGTTPCMLRGSEDLIRVCKSRISEQQFQTSSDGTLSWEEVECLGACANAPMVMVFKDTYEDLSPERLEEIIDAFASGKGATIKPGPQNGRECSEPLSGLTSLTDEKILLKRNRNRAVEKKPTAKNGGAAKPAKVAAKAPAAKTAPAKAAAIGTVKQTLQDKNRPVAMKRPASPDNLRLISGVGPKIEGILHELGIFTFKQVSTWKKAEREWVDGYLKFKGRIEREDWVKQARALSKGVDEYVRVFGKKPR